ncbi:MAG: phosphocholine cytidylyltransferase family protein [Gammaproteobacteria bacterium]|nr:phosphocholine cytidylyltransferase family protein [Gammaproteobacteria bacterium]MCP5201212.1 phosphocholine cytidylyltransferase family protein [Gammaproteobacteria bacterium]
MKAIILSAGQGRRLLPLTEQRPKAALAVGPRAVLEWQLHEIGQCTVDEVVVVTGFGADYIDAIVAGQHAVPARTLYNPFYAACDNLGTCWVARHEMTAPFVVINGDTLFEAAILQRLLDDAARAPITLVTDSKAGYDADDMKVVVADGRLRRVGKQLDLARVTGESIGMMHFDARGARRFREQVDYMMRHGSGLKQWYLSAIDTLAGEDIVTTCAIDGLSWGEIDDRADLERAASIVAAWRPARRPHTPAAS